MLSVEWRTLRTRFCKADCMLASEFSRRPVSSWLRTSMRLVRSKRAMASATSTARESGCVIERASQNDKPTPASNADKPNASKAQRACRLASSTRFAAESSSVRSCCITAFMASWNAAAAGWNSCSKLALARSASPAFFAADTASRVLR